MKPRFIAGIGIALLWAVQFSVGMIVLYGVSIQQHATQLQTIQARLHDDIQYHNGQWDTYRYNADPAVPGNAYSVYIITTDGFVMERWHPIHGLLDTSDFKHLLQLASPQTITTITNQTWRVFSLPIRTDNRVVGVITVSSFSPSQEDLTDIDASLQTNAQRVLASLTVKGDSISAQNLDIRTIPYTVSFQVVDQFNKIIVKNNNFNSIDRLPNFIDPSYVDQTLHNSPERVVKDSQTGEHFYVVSSAYKDVHGRTVGLIVVTQSISYVYQLLLWFILAQCGVGGVIALCMVLWSRIHPDHTFDAKLPLTHIHFDKKTSTLELNEVQLPIPFATNQYYLCEAICSHPKKKWEIGELLERFGIEASQDNARKVYDAMLLLNKKILSVQSVKLVSLQDKRYFCNPDLAPFIVS